MLDWCVCLPRAKFQTPSSALLLVVVIGAAVVVVVVVDVVVKSETQFHSRNSVTIINIVDRKVAPFVSMASDQYHHLSDM